MRRSQCLFGNWTVLIMGATIIHSEQHTMNNTQWTHTNTSEHNVWMRSEHTHTVKQTQIHSALGRERTQEIERAQRKGDWERRLRRFEQRDAVRRKWDCIHCIQSSALQQWLNYCSFKPTRVSMRNSYVLCALYRNSSIVTKFHIPH